ncbi:MAG: glycosyltransferase [Campylobacter sp.]|nr:glycosyltransferase [Campylobacter sp.]
MKFKLIFGQNNRLVSRLAKALSEGGDTCEKIQAQNSKNYKDIAVFDENFCLNMQDDSFIYSNQLCKYAHVYHVNEIYTPSIKQKPFWWAFPKYHKVIKLEKYCMQNAKLIIANSKMLKNEICETFAIDPARIKVVYDGVNLIENLSKAQAKLSLTNELDIDFELCIVLFSSEDFKKDGLDSFLTLLSKVKQKFNILILGDDKNMAFYKNLSKSLGLNALFLGKVMQYRKFFEASDIFILPSNSKRFANIVLEAMSYKNVVFASRTNAICEILDEKFILNEESQNLIEAFMINYDSCLKRGEKNYKIAKIYNMQDQISQLCTLLRSLT